MAEIAGDLEESCSEVDEICKDFLRQVHPDTHDGAGRTYTATEVAAMLNAVRDAAA